MKTVDDRVTVIVSRVALGVALVAGLSLPLGYGLVASSDFSQQLDFKATVKATALGRLIAVNPGLWMYAENQLQGLLTREPVPLEFEHVEVFDQHGALLAEAGPAPAWPAMRRAQAVFDASRLTGRVEVSASLRGLLWGIAATAALGALLATAVFSALRILPLRALKRVTGALFEQKMRAQVTLSSIGEAVITTDPLMHVEFMNPVAERLSGWTLTQARGRPLADVLHLFDTLTGQAADSPLQQALDEQQIVALDRHLDLQRPDGSRISIADSAAPIPGAEGRIAGGVLTFRDVSAARALALRRDWEAAHDVLTGLVNRREFAGVVEAALLGARNLGKQHVLCYLDLDRFKFVNDSCGHAAGDDLLKEVAALLQSRIRESDTLARLGGDEFGLLLEGCTLERAQMIAADLLAAVADLRFKRDAKVFTIGVSIGLVPVSGDSSSGSELMSMADAACYWAKEQGRNRACVYRSGDSDMAVRRREMGWVARIKQALADQRFVLYHQSYLSLQDALPADQTQHLEVLLRMIDEQGELIQPGSFIPAAERYNLMPAVDRWVIAEVFSRYRELLARRGGGRLVCAINLSGTSLNDESFIDFVRAQVGLHQLPAGAICFEITETAAIANLRHAAAFIAECKSMGLLFALDDFGNGTSSFAYLKCLPVDYLKIDGGFVRNLGKDAIDRAMTETINRIGHIMGIKTVAEYAESASLIEDLRQIGVDYAQGYAVCEPKPLF